MLEWLKSKLHTQIQIAGVVGSTINHVGSEYGMLSSGLTMLGLLTFGMTDLKGFGAYQRHVDKKKVLFDKENDANGGAQSLRH